jgi:dTDP-3,4-didehydro-2,6-dideoxy-alpha-D-glucose 3-reductase
MTRKRVGVMGCAEFAWRAMIPGMIESTEIEIIAVASRNAEKAERFANRFQCDPVVGYENLLKRTDIEAVYIPLPTGLHEEWVIKAIQAGKHVWVEKSFASDIGSAQKMVDIACKNHLVIIENFLFPHHSQHLWVMNFINQGYLGDIHLFRSTFGFPFPPKSNFRYDRKLGGGALLDVGTYVIKASRLFLGDDLVHLSSTLKYDSDLGIDISGDVCFKNPDGQVAQVSFGFNYFYQCQYELLGSKGKLTVTRAFTPPPSLQPVVIFEKQDHVQQFALAADNHYVNMSKYFVDAMENRVNDQSLFDDLLSQAELINKIDKLNPQ